MGSASDKADNVAGLDSGGLKKERIGSAPNLLMMTHFGRPGPLSVTSSAEDNDDDAGALLSALSLGGSSAKTATRHKTAANQTEASPDPGIDFQLGRQPSGDVFISHQEIPTEDTVHARHDFSVGRSRTREAAEAVKSADDPVTPARTLRTRPSNISITSSARHHVGGVDAQGVYPPSACVFVANLPEPRDDRSLEAAVTREFSKYGTVFVKIRRDLHHMPFAFCQFTRDEDARLAMEHGKGAIILGRACRTEMVKANRSYYIYRRRGDTITLGEARSVLEPFGAISRVELLVPRLQEAMGVPTSVVVEFAAFDPGRDLHSIFRHNENYHVDALDPKKSLQPRRNDADEAFLNQYEVDRRSVFVGGLSTDVDEGAVEDLFSRAGAVVKVQVIKKPTTSGIRAFAFIEFERADTPEAAITAFHDYELGNSKLRVERKVVREHTPRRVRSQHLSPYRSPRDTGGIFAPSTPEMAESGDACEAGQGAKTLSVPVAQPSPTVASTPVQSWSWMYPPQSPTQVSFGGQGYVAGPSPPYGAQVGGVGIPMTPQATPGSFSPYPAYYSPYWPGVGFVQDPVTVMAHYAANASPTATSFVDSHAGDGSGTLDTPTRVIKKDCSPESGNPTAV